MTQTTPEHEQPLHFLPGRMVDDTLYLTSIPSWAKYPGVDGRVYDTAQDCARANEMYWKEKV